MAWIIDINDANLDEFLTHERTALILTRTSCGNCANYAAEIEELADQGELDGLVVGKVMMDQAGSLKLKRQNPWIKEVEFLPFTALYHHGELVENFAALKGSYLKMRVNKLWS